MDRGGQVFYVYNRVDTIDQKFLSYKNWCLKQYWICSWSNEWKFSLKNLMDFIEGVYDVLVATTIIETGVDISTSILFH